MIDLCVQPCQMNVGLACYERRWPPFDGTIGLRVTDVVMATLFHQRTPAK